MKDKLGVTKVYILDDKDAYGKGVADAFEQAAKDEGMKVAGHTGWDANAQNYKALMTQVKASGADGVYIGGIACFNGGQLIKDKVSDRRRQRRGQAARLRRLRPRLALRRGGSRQPRRHVRERSCAQPGGPDRSGEDVPRRLPAKYGAPEVYTAYAAAAAQVLLDAIGRSDGSREDVVAKLFETNITDGIVGPMSFNANGDPTAGLISIFLAEASGAPWKFVEAKKVEASS